VKNVSSNVARFAELIVNASIVFRVVRKRRPSTRAWMIGKECLYQVFSSSLRIAGEESDCIASELGHRLAYDVGQINLGE
jgi:hypothetical protein